MLRSALQLLSGQSAGFIFRLLRNLLIARLLPIEDYGVASIFAIITTAVEAASQIGLGQLLIQRDDWNEPKVQAAVQGISAMRGLLNALALFLLAAPIADLFSTPQAADAIRLLALKPLIAGFAHFDLMRRQRLGEFAPSAIAFVVPTAISLVAVWPLYLWLGDYHVMVGVILIDALAYTAVSQILVRRRYQLAFDLSLMRSGFRFGWPLLINAVLIFLTMQGEKVVVARELGMVAMGVFSMGVTLSFTPTAVLSRTIQTLLLPRLSAAKAQEAAFQRLSHVAIESNLLNGMIMSAGVIVIGPYFLALVFGEKFNALDPLLPTFALLYMLRVAKAGPAVVGIARGNTGNPMIGNLGRLAALPFVWWAANAGHGMLEVLLIASAGEAAGVVMALELVRRRASVFFSPMAAPLAAYAAFVLLVTLISLLAPPSLDHPGRMILVALSLAIGLGGGFATMRGLHLLARQMLRPRGR